MTLATRSSFTLNVPFTFAQFITAVETAMVSAGFGATVYDSFNSSDNLTTNIVNQLVFDSTKGRGQVFHKVRTVIDANGIISMFQQLHAGWDKTNHVGVHSGREIEMSSSYYNAAIITSLTGATLYFYTFSHPEIKMILINQGTLWFRLDLWRPASKLISSVFDENIFPFAFISRPDLARFYSCNSDVSPFGASSMPSGDTNTYAPDMYALEYSEFIRYKVTACNVNKDVRHAAPEFFSTAGQGALAQFSEDIGLLGSDSMSYFQEVTVNGNTHVLIVPRSGICGVTIAAAPSV